MILIILASGMGKRLNKKIPKCLVNVNNINLLERILLNSKNFEKVIVVGGYKINLIKKVIKIQDRSNIILINNKDYKKTNMVESFFKAFGKIDQDVIVSYSDIIYDASLLKKMTSFKFNHILLKSNWKKVWEQRMSAREIKSDAEDIRVNKNFITEIGAKIQKKLPKYQFMGLIRLNYNILKKIKKFYKKINNNKIDFTSFINLLIQKKITKFKYRQTKKYWFEIDTQKDLLASKKFFK